MATAEENHAKIEASKNSGGDQQKADDLMRDKSQARVAQREKANQSSGTGQKDPASASSSLAKINETLAGMLKWCWQNLIFFSFSSSIIWIDIHVLGNMILPKMFCKLGHEWIPSELKKTSPKKAAAFGDQVGSCEKGCCCCVNGFCGLITIALLAIAAAVVGIINSTIGQIFGWISGVWDSLTHFVGS